MTGTTARRLSAVAASSPLLWTGLDALGTVLSRARELRGTGRLNTEERGQLAHLLTGDSVLVDVKTVPVSERDLLEADRTEHRISIEDLLGRLRDVYEPLRDGIAEIDAVWRDILPRLDAAETTRAELEAEVETLGVTEPTVGIMARQLVDVRAKVMDDPLGLDPEIGPDLDRSVSEAAHAVGQLRRGHDELDEDLVRTETLVAEARVLRSRAAAALAEARAKLAAPTGLKQVPSAALIDEVATRAGELRSGTEPWQYRRTRLDRWLDVVTRLVEQLRMVEAANRAPLDQRDQLRGLLSAYRSKAAAVGRVERTGVADLADEAHTELYTAPTNLVRASRLVLQLADQINTPDGANPGGSEASYADVGDPETRSPETSNPETNNPETTNPDDTRGPN